MLVLVNSVLSLPTLANALLLLFYKNMLILDTFMLQVEFYFSDINLATTDHLLGFMIKDPDGYGKVFPKNVYFHDHFACTIQLVNFLNLPLKKILPLLQYVIPVVVDLTEKS